MKKTVIICDRCGAEIEENDALEIYGYDLCPQCSYKAKETIERWMVQNVPAKERYNPAGIDWGKAQALRDAGWSLARIEQEIGASKSEIRKHTSPAKKRKKYDNEFNEAEPAIMRSPKLT